MHTSLTHASGLQWALRVVRRLAGQLDRRILPDPPATRPAVLRIAAGFALLFGLSPKLAAVLKSLPQGVLGGVSILLFGMIASVGIRTLSEARIDFAHSRNLIVVSLILVLGLGGAKVPLAVGGLHLELHGMALAALVGILANALLPASIDPEREEHEPAAH